MLQRLLVFSALLILQIQSTAASAQERPNFIYILSDDLAQGDLGCYGQKLIQTPNLDRMAAEGTRFTQAYSGTSVCAPSRASLMTGLHSGHCPIRANREVQPEGQKPLPPGTFTVAQLLKNNGYSTACIGKWGMGMFDTSGSPLKVGFDHFYGYNCQRHAHSYFPAYLYNDDQRFELPGNNGKEIGQTYAQNLISEECLRWIRDHKDEPFFLFHSITLPHGRFEIDDQGIYKDQPWTEQQKNYAAMVTRLDSDVGRILDLLRELGLDQKTLVITSGDNGSSFNPNSEIGKLFDQTMGGQLRGFKRGLYEGGLRQASIAWQPGTVPAGRVSDESWAFWDYLPTVADIIGVSPAPTGDTRFAICANPVDHREICEIGASQVNQSDQKFVTIGGTKRAEWVPVAKDDRQQSRIAGPNDSVLLRTVTTGDGTEDQVLVLLDGELPESVSGTRIRHAGRTAEGGRSVLSIELDEQGGEEMRALTTRYSPNEQVGSHRGSLAVIIQGKVYSTPRINAPIAASCILSTSLFATEIDHLAKQLAPEWMTDGLSLKTFLQGGAAPQRDYFYWELHEGASIQAVRFGEWKAVRNGPRQDIELYNLTTDVAESKNVAQEHPELVAKAAELMTSARTEDPAWPLQPRRQNRTP